MKFIYPALIRKEKEDLYIATFPDLACCEAKGDSLEDCIVNANEAAFDWITLELSEDDGVLPPVTDIEDIPLKENEYVRSISVNIRFQDGWDE